MVPLAQGEQEEKCAELWGPPGSDCRLSSGIQGYRWQPTAFGSAVAINVMRMVKGVWVSLTSSFFCDVFLCGDVRCLYIHSSLPAAHRTCDETVCSFPCPRLGCDSLVNTFPSGDKARTKGCESSLVPQADQ